MNLSENKKNFDYDPDSKKFIILFMTVQFLGFFYYNGMRVIFPIFLQYSGFSQNQVIADWATIFGIGLFLGSMTRYPVGILVDKLTRNQSIFFSISLLVISTIIINFTTDVFILSLVFAVIRTGTHVPPLLGRGYVNETDRKKQGKVNGYLFVSANIGGIIAPILFTFLFDISLVTMVIVNNILLISLLIFYYFYIPPKKIKKNYPLIEFVRTSLTELFSKFKRVIVLFIILGLVNGVILYLQVPYALYILGLTTNETGTIVGLITLGNTIFIFFAGSLTDKLGVRQTIYGGFLLVILGSFIQIINMSNIWFFFISQLTISNGVVFVVNGLTTNVTLQSKKETAASMFGGTSTFFFFGSSLIPGVASMLYIQDPSLPFWLMIGISLLVFPFGLLINGRMDKSKIYSYIE